MPTPPTQELGSVHRFGTTGTLLGWNQLVDDLEYIPDLLWPKSVKTYRSMRSDAQLDGLYRGISLPLERRQAMIDPNGAPPDRVKLLAADLNLPVLGEEPGPRPRRKGRFSHKKHFHDALRAIFGGHYFFEQVAVYGEDGYYHLRKLAPRPPYTLTEINVENDGGLRSIKGPDYHAAEIPVERLVAYVWDLEGADWTGRSMFRACYPNWMIKQREMRLDATKHERTSAGMPIFEAPEGASKEQIEALDRMAQAYKVGERSGGAVPPGTKTKLMGVEGNTSDVVASMRFHNEEMARALLLMLFTLGGDAQSGSRALGSEFTDFFEHALDAVADWYTETFNEHVIEDWVDWNFGDDEPAPELILQSSSQDLAVADLAVLVEKGIVQVDPELEESIRQRYKLPRGADNPTDTEPPATPPIPAGEAEDEGAEQTLPPAQAALTPRMLSFATEPRRWPEIARSAGRQPTDGTARRARDHLISTGQLVRLPDGRLHAKAAGAATAFRRDPTDFEIRAAVDFEVMSVTYLNARSALIRSVQEAQEAQLQEAVSLIESASGLSDLATVRVEPIDSAVIASAMREAAGGGYAQVENEMRAQGAEPVIRTAAGDEEELDEQIDEQAAAVALVLAGSYSEAVSRRAVALAGGGALSMGDVATGVREHMESLTDAFLQQELGGAIQGGMNAGRFSAMRANPAERYAASELLDENTCGPCAEIDGEEFESLDDLEANYPGLGGYALCEGGPRCRGTGIAIWHASTPAPGAPAPVAS